MDYVAPSEPGGDRETARRDPPKGIEKINHEFLARMRDDAKVWRRVEKVTRECAERYAERFFRGRPDAQEDVVQRVVTEAMDKFLKGGFDPRKGKSPDEYINFWGWINRIARWRCLDVAKENKKRACAEELEILATRANQALLQELDEALVIVRNEIAGITSARYREFLEVKQYVEHLFGGGEALTIAETAQFFGMSFDVANNVYARAKKALEKRLLPHGMSLKGLKKFRR